MEHVPAGEPLIVAVAPHRNWIDPFLILLVVPALPRLYFVAASDTTGARWKALAIAIAGGMAPVSSRGTINRAGLETSLAILGNGSRLGIFPEGWGATRGRWRCRRSNGASHTSRRGQAAA